MILLLISGSSAMMFVSFLVVTKTGHRFLRNIAHPLVVSPIMLLVLRLSHHCDDQDARLLVELL